MTTDERDELLKKMARAILGEPELGHKGLADRMKEVEDYIEEDKTLKKKVTGGVLVLSFIGSGVVAFATWLINKLFV